MNKQNLLTLTLIISGLALNPVMAESVVERISHNQTSSQSISNGMSTVLYNRGLEEDAADEMVENFLDGTDDGFTS